MACYAKPFTRTLGWGSDPPYVHGQRPVGHGGDTMTRYHRVVCHVCIDDCWYSILSPAWSADSPAWVLFLHIIRRVKRVRIIRIWVKLFLFVHSHIMWPLYSNVDVHIFVYKYQFWWKKCFSFFIFIFSTWYGIFCLHDAEVCIMWRNSTLLRQRQVPLSSHNSQLNTSMVHNASTPTCGQSSNHA